MAAEATIDPLDILSQILGIRSPVTATDTFNGDENDLDETFPKNAKKKLLRNTCWIAPPPPQLADEDESKSSHDNSMDVDQENLSTLSSSDEDGDECTLGGTLSCFGEPKRDEIYKPFKRGEIYKPLKRGKMYKPPKHLLDERYNFDFTNVRDDNKIFMRGGYRYIPPYGWKRYGLKVEGKFKNDEWFKGKSPRKDATSSADGEWAISYHGTSLNNGLSIAEEGYKLSKGKGFAYGKGIYSAPAIHVAERYARICESNGIKYMVVIQSRVNPSELIIIPKEKTNVGEYWIVPNEEHIRPYGFCVLQVSPSN